MRVDELQQEIDELAILLKQTIDRMIPEQQRAFDEKLAQARKFCIFKKKMGGLDCICSYMYLENQPTTNPEELQPRFRCNDEVRKILYDIIQTEEQSILVANQIA